MDDSGFAAAAMWTFLAYTAGVFVLAWMSHRILTRREFLSEYYLGSRGLGVIAFTLTLGATSASAGSFAGFPALIYAHGWVLALWIAGYMMVPLCAMGLLGKRLNQMARATGCITLPDVLRERFRSPALALSASLLIVLMLSVFLIPQFKLAALILQQLVGESEWFAAASARLSPALRDWGIDGEYVLCLLIFAVLVVAYTTLGGFRAVVWTDVLQGVIMVAGVVVLLFLALTYVGGMSEATRQLGQMTTPRLGTAQFRLAATRDEAVRVPLDRWFTLDSNSEVRLFRLNESAVVQAGATLSAPTKVVEVTTPAEIAAIRETFAETMGLPSGVSAELVEVSEYAFGAGEPGVYVRAPGPALPAAADDEGAPSTGFLSVGLALSFFIYWTISGAGQPGTMVRLMAFDSSQTLRRSIAALTVYFGMIYFPLVIIFCCARLIVPGIDHTPDRVMPALAYELAGWAGAPWLAGLLLAVPFAAAMSTVDSFMLMISSSVVRDVYQHQINPGASPRTIKLLSYGCMVVVGGVVTVGAMNPPKFLQYLIVFAGGGLSVSFLAPIAMALYWPRANLAGTLAAMFGGFAAYIGLYVAGFLVHGRATPIYLLQLDPMVWGVLASLGLGGVVSLMTSPPPADLVRRFFYVDDRAVGAGDQIGLP